MKISVLLPAYNSEKYISNTIDSILAQTMQDFEIVVVNDGSTDNTLSILEEYSCNPKIRIVTQVNRGVAEARNYGLKFISGDFVVMPDADDILEPTMLENLYAAAIKSNTDIIVGAYNNVNEVNNTTYLRSLGHNQLNYKNITDNIFDLYTNQLISSLWNKIFKRSAIGSTRFKNVSFGEDTIFILELLYKGASLSYINIPVYNYISRNTSNLLNTYRPDFANTLSLCYNSWKQFLDKFPPEKYDSSVFLQSMYVANNFELFRNIYMFNSPLNFRARSEYIKNIVLINWKLCNYPNSYNIPNPFRRLYYLLYKTGNPLLLNIVYSFLFYLKKRIA